MRTMKIITLFSPQCFSTLPSSISTTSTSTSSSSFSSSRTSSGSFCCCSFEVFLSFVANVAVFLWDHQKHHESYGAVVIVVEVVGSSFHQQLLLLLLLLQQHWRATVEEIMHSGGGWNPDLQRKKIDEYPRSPTPQKKEKNRQCCSSDLFCSGSKLWSRAKVGELRWWQEEEAGRRWGWASASSIHLGDVSRGRSR